MSQTNLNCIPMLNDKIIVLELLLEYHNKVDALLEIALQGDLLQNSKSVVHNFLWVLNDIIKQARMLNEDLLNTALKTVTLLSGTRQENEAPFDKN